MLHMNAKDLSGRKIGKLTVMHQDGKTDDGHIAWYCRCDCGNGKRIASNSLLRISPVQSCGCMNKTTEKNKIRHGGTWNEGKSYCIRDGGNCYKTRHGWAIAAIRKYGNKCEICGWDKARCDVHHRIPKSVGGLHTLQNAIVLCPNCHRETHNEMVKIND